MRITPGLEAGTRPTDTPGPVEATTGGLRRSEVQARGTSLAGEEEEVVAVGRTVTGERRTVTETAGGTREAVTPTPMVAPMVDPMATPMETPMAALTLPMVTPMVTLMATPMVTPMRMVTPLEAMVIPPTAMAIPPMVMVIHLMATAALTALTGQEMPGRVNLPRPSVSAAPTTSVRSRGWTRTGLTVGESRVMEEVWPSRPGHCSTLPGFLWESDHLQLRLVFSSRLVGSEDPVGARRDSISTGRRII